MQKFLLAQNPSTSADLGGGEFENQASIGNAINSGLVLIFHDQGIGNNEVELTNTIPGLDDVIFTRQVAEDINLSTQAKDSNLSTSIVSSGLAGNLNDNSLDGVNNSRHGFVELNSLPNNAIPLLTTNNPDERCKLNIFISGKELKTQNLRVASFCQNYQNNRWVNKDINDDSNIKLENAILNKAKKLKLESS